MNRQYQTEANEANNLRRDIQASLSIRTVRLVLLRLRVVRQADAINVVEVGRVREDDLIASFQPVEDLDRVDGGAAQFHADALRFQAVFRDLEKSNGRVGLAVNGTAYVENVLQLFDVNGGIDA